MFTNMFINDFHMKLFPGSSYCQCWLQDTSSIGKQRISCDPKYVYIEKKHCSLYNHFYMTLQPAAHRLRVRRATQTRPMTVIVLVNIR